MDFYFSVKQTPVRKFILLFQVSSDPATRLDVLKLGEHLDMGLQQQQARETGICPVRRRLFAQCFGINIKVFSFF